MTRLCGQVSEMIAAASLQWAWRCQFENSRQL